MTIETPTHDPFEQRLHDQLTARAADLVTPEDGLAHIRARVNRRRRARRGGWLSAGAALVVIAGVVGIALRSTDRGETPFADTETTPSSELTTIAPVDGRNLVEASTQPAWLALPGQPPERVLGLHHEEGTSFSYSVVEPLPDQASSSTITLNVREHDLTQRLGPWADAEIGGHPAVTGADNGSAVVILDLGEGWVAELTAGPAGAGGAPPPAEVLPGLVAIAAQLEDRGAPYWMPILDRELSAWAADSLDQDPRWSGYRLGLQDQDGRSYVGAIGPGEVRSELTVPGTPDGTYMLRSTAVAAKDPGAAEEPQVNQMPPGTSIRVRGHDGVLGAQMDDDDTVRRMLAWKEDGYQFRLYFSESSTLEQALALAEQLRPLDDDHWANAVFPEKVPSTLTDFGWMWAIPEDGPASAS